MARRLLLVLVVLTIEDMLGLGPLRTREQMSVTYRTAEGLLFMSGRPPHWWWRKEIRRATSHRYSVTRTTGTDTARVAR